MNPSTMRLARACRHVITHALRGVLAGACLLSTTLILCALNNPVLAAQAAQAAQVAPADEPLDVDAAFRGSAAIADGGQALLLRWQVAPGHHLYRERFTLRPLAGPGTWSAPALPPGRLVHDTNLDEDLHYWEGAPEVRVPLAAAPAGVHTLALAVGYQGCADAGLCYPPQSAEVTVTFDTHGRLQQAQWRGASADAEVPAAAAPATAASTASAAPSDDGRIAQALRSGRLPLVASVFLLAGLLLSFTPCVLPMVPILSSIIVGQSGTVSRQRGFALALAYALGMAAVYTLFGVAAGLAGEGLAAALQNPWGLGAFGLLLTALAASMFGLFPLQLPGSLQSRLGEASNRLPGGRFAGVFAMGGLSALIVGPCVAAPLAGALVYISQTRDVWLGGLALFCLAMGMSLPLLLVGASAGTLLPRAGRWMDGVKTVFGFALLAVAWWLVQPVMPVALAMGLAGVLLVLAAARLADAARQAPTLRPWGLGLALVMCLGGVAQLAGALSGGSSLTQPLQHFAARGAAGGATAGTTMASAAAAGAEPRFTRVADLAELERQLARTSRPVMLDFYADWCVACKELAATTFKDPAVRARLDGALLLQADVTANSAEHRALLRRFGLFGPPGVLFFDPRGQELASARTIGYQGPADFLRQLGRAGL